MQSPAALADPARRVRPLAAALLTLVLAACTTSRAPPPRASSPTVKIGKPYQVFGTTYYPSDDRSYDQRGLASWYGPGFHALATANGERYDQDDLTAAHKTLPMPSFVEVENLDNGRRLTVRINDRGPFVDGRIIDLSRRAAQLLGVDRPGTARVRVRRVYPDTPWPAPVMASAAPAMLPPTPVPSPVLVALPTPAPVTIIPAAAPAPGSFVQVAALSDPGRIAWLTGYLAAFGRVVTEPSPSGATRVRLGPYAGAEAANAALAQVRAAGYSDAVLIPARTAP